MKIEITSREQDILHFALIRYLECAVKLADIAFETGCTLDSQPAMEIKKLHSKIASAKEDKP